MDDRTRLSDKTRSIPRKSEKNRRKDYIFPSISSACGDTVWRGVVFMVTRPPGIHRRALPGIPHRRALWGGAQAGHPKGEDSVERGGARAGYTEGARSSMIPSVP